MEEQLGPKLFRRHDRGFELTELDHSLLASAHAMREAVHYGEADSAWIDNHCIAYPDDAAPSHHFDEQGHARLADLLRPHLTRYFEG